MRSSTTPNFVSRALVALAGVLFDAPTCDPITDTRKGKIWRVLYQRRW